MLVLLSGTLAVVSQVVLSHRAYLESDVAVSEELIQKYSSVVLGHINGTVKELRRLFLVDDLVDALTGSVLQLEVHQPCADRFLADPG